MRSGTQEDGSVVFLSTQKKLTPERVSLTCSFLLLRFVVNGRLVNGMSRALVPTNRCKDAHFVRVICCLRQRDIFAVQMRYICRCDILLRNEKKAFSGGRRWHGKAVTDEAQHQGTVLLC